MHHLADYWDAMAVRRNAKTPYWWLPAQHPDPRADVPPPTFPVTPPSAQNGTTPTKES